MGIRATDASKDTAPPLGGVTAWRLVLVADGRCRNMGAGTGWFEVTIDTVGLQAYGRK